MTRHTPRYRPYIYEPCVSSFPQSAARRPPPICSSQPCRCEPPAPQRLTPPYVTLRPILRCQGRYDVGEHVSGQWHSTPARAPAPGAAACDPWTRSTLCDPASSTAKQSAHTFGAIEQLCQDAAVAPQIAGWARPSQQEADSGGASKGENPQQGWVQVGCGCREKRRGLEWNALCTALNARASGQLCKQVHLNHFATRSGC